MTPSLTFRLWSSENQIVGVKSRSRRTKPITKRGNVHCDWFILPTPTIWFSLDCKRNVSGGVGRNGNVLILLTPLTTAIFDLFRKWITIWTIKNRVMQHMQDNRLDFLFFSIQPFDQWGFRQNLDGDDEEAFLSIAKKLDRRSEQLKVNK